MRCTDTYRKPPIVNWLANYPHDYTRQADMNKWFNYSLNYDIIITDLKKFEVRELYIYFVFLSFFTAYVWISFSNNAILKNNNWQYTIYIRLLLYHNEKWYKMWYTVCSPCFATCIDRSLHRCYEILSHNLNQWLVLFSKVVQIYVAQCTCVVCFYTP